MFLGMLFSWICIVLLRLFSICFMIDFQSPFLLENATKMTSQIDPRGDPFDQKGSKSVAGLSGRSVWSRPGREISPKITCWSILVAFRHHFDPSSTLLAPVWHLFGAFWSPNIPRCNGTSFPPYPTFFQLGVWYDDLQTSGSAALAVRPLQYRKSILLHAILCKTVRWIQICNPFWLKPSKMMSFWRFSFLHFYMFSFFVILGVGGMRL